MDKYLDLTVLTYFFNRLKTLFATKTSVDDLSDRVDEIVAEGGEPNKIDTVKVNGTALTPDSEKAVNVEVPIVEMQGYDDIRISPNSEATGFTLTKNANGMSVFTEAGTSQLASTDYVAANGGKIDVIKVNGSVQTITNKTVDITVPIDISELVNDRDYQTEAQVQALIDSELEGITGIDFQVVDTLPSTGVKGVIYLLHKGGTSSDIYDEYIWITPSTGDPHYEKIGTTDIDLSDYWSKTELVAITTAEIDALFE